MSRLGTARERDLAQNLSGRGANSTRLGVSNVLFKPITLISLILIGLFAFGALIVLGGFAKDLRKLPPGQATPRSVSAVGYQAFTEYLEGLDYDIRETRGKRPSYERINRLVVYTPARPTRRSNNIVKSEGKAINLIILPKWSVGQMNPRRGEEGRKDWVRKTRGKGLFYAGSYDVALKNLPVIRRHERPSPDTEVFFNSNFERNLSETYKPDFKDLQYFDLDTRWSDYKDELKVIELEEREARRRKEAEERGKTYKPREKKEKEKTEAEEKDKKEKKKEDPLPKHDVLLKIDGRPVLIQLEGTQTYILSEPDLVNTMAFQTQGGAQLSGAILDEVIYDASSQSLTADFDVSLHGIENNQNVVKLMVTPPFLAATLCLLAAGGLVAWQGFNRFGDPARPRPDYAQGPVSLAKTAAEFMDVAGRAHKTGDNYAELIRRHVANDLGYKDRSAAYLDKLLDAREKRLKIQPNFAELKSAIAGAADTQSYSHYARALTIWREAMTQNDIQQDPKDS